VQLEPVYKKYRIFNTSGSRGEYASPADAYASSARLLKQSQMNKKVLGTRCLDIFRSACYLCVVLKDIVILNLFVSVMQHL
jgi:hypothetical protein